MALPGELTPKDAARNIILGAIERDLAEWKANEYTAAWTNQVIAQIAKEMERLQKKWGFDN